MQRSLHCKAQLFCLVKLGPVLSRDHSFSPVVDSPCTNSQLTNAGSEGLWRGFLSAYLHSIIGLTA